MVMFRINKKVISAYLSTLIAFFTLLLCLQISVKAQMASSVEDLIKSISDGKLQVETKAVPYKLVADFNGDKAKDVAVIVSLSDTVENIAKNVKIEYPYLFGKEVSTDDLALFM